MKRNTYYKIFNRLNTSRDVHKVKKTFLVPEDALFSILSQKIVRNTKKDYYIVQRQSSAMYREWKYGKSLLQIAEERVFAPVLTASFILKEHGLTKRQFKGYIADLPSIKDKRLRDELSEVIEEDFIYSPQGIENQKHRGVFCEDQIQNWLDARSIEYMTEEDSRSMERRKTPDFLFYEELAFNGFRANWIESKGSFGSPYQARHDYNNQISHYVELFGPGIISYWVGYVDDITMGAEVQIVDREYFCDE